MMIDAKFSGSNSPWPSRIDFLRAPREAELETRRSSIREAIDRPVRCRNQRNVVMPCRDRAKVDFVLMAETFHVSIVMQSTESTRIIVRGKLQVEKPDDADFFLPLSSVKLDLHEARRERKVPFEDFHVRKHVQESQRVEGFLTCYRCTLCLARARNR